MDLTMLIFLSGPFFLLTQANEHQFGEISIAYVFGGALGEEVDVVLIVLELVFLLKLRLCLLLFLNAQFLDVPCPPSVGVDVFVVLLDPRHSLLLSHLHLLIVIVILH